MKIKVNSFKNLSEGTGIISYRNRALGNVFSQKNIGLLMLGSDRMPVYPFRKKGKVAKKKSTDLGMNWVLQKFVERTSVGLSKDDPCIAAALVEASKGNFTALRNLSRRNTPSGINSDLELFKSVLEVIRDEYCRALLRWVKNHVPLDEVLICGGTGEFVRRELTQYFQTESIPIVWNGGVDIPKSLDTVGLGDDWLMFGQLISYEKTLDENFCYERKIEISTRFLFSSS